MAGLLQSGERPLRMEAHELEKAEDRHAIAARRKRCASAVDAERQTLARFGWHFKSKQYLAADLGGEFDP
eukprot:4656421-Pyramimonas_sp.AAC.1